MSTTEQTLPSLPEPDGYAAIKPHGTVIVPPREYAQHNCYAVFTAMQMREYVLADRRQRAVQGARMLTKPEVTKVVVEHWHKDDNEFNDDFAEAIQRKSFEVNRIQLAPTGAEGGQQP